MTDRPRRRWPRIVGALGVVAVLAALAVWIAVHDALGEAPSGERLDRIAQSPHYVDGRFQNALPTVSTGMSAQAAWAYLTGGSDDRQPDAALPIVSRTAADFAPVRRRRG